MARLKYYADEKARHPALQAAQVENFADAVEAIRRLAARFEFERFVRAVVPTSGARRSIYRVRDCTIKLNVDGLSWLTVIHEAAHAAHQAEWIRRRRVAVKGAPTVVLQPGWRAVPPSWHNAEHAEFVDLFARIVTENGWIESIPAERRARAAEEATKIAEKAAEIAEREAVFYAPATVRTRKIERRRAQVSRLERKIKSLTTRLRTAQRSLAALERAARKEPKP